MAIIADHHSSADHIGIALDQILLLKGASAQEPGTRNENPSPLLHDADEVLASLLRAIYEELLEEPGNILFTTQVNPGTVRCEVMEIGFWRECLAKLKRQPGGIEKSEQGEMTVLQFSGHRPPR